MPHSKMSSLRPASKILPLRGRASGGGLVARRTGEGLDLRQSRSRKAPVVATAIRGEGGAIGWEGRLAEAPQFRGKPSPGKPGRNDTLRKKEECGKPFRGKPFRGKPSPGKPGRNDTL